MLITPELLQAYNGIHAPATEAARELLLVHIGAAQQVISDYVGFDAEEALSEEAGLSEPARAAFRTAALRIATLLQLECGGNIGVSQSSGDFSQGRSFLNIVDYTPYLKPLSAFRRNTGM